VTTARDDFLRRYATSPIHVPRLERLLGVYGSGEEDDPFCRQFIAWDRACPDGEAARIVTEILSAGDATGRIRKYGDDVIRGAIRWMSDLASVPVAERARVLRDRLNASGGDAGFVQFLAEADRIEHAEFLERADTWVGPQQVAEKASNLK
jgi:hypothetical protein